MFTYGLRNVGGILSMGGVPIPSIENPHSIFAYIWKRFEESDEPAFIVELVF
jgi:hypothetical protein